MVYPSHEKALEILAFDVQGASFFERATEALAIATGYRWAGIFLLLPDKKNVRTEAFWCDGKLSEPVVFCLQGAPCEKLYDPNEHHYGAMFCNNLKQQFPKFDHFDAQTYQAQVFFDDKGDPIGHVATLDGSVVEQTEADRNFFRLMAQRIGAEYCQLVLKDALELRSRMIESTSHMISFVDKDYIYRVVSKGYEVLFDRSVNDIIGRSVCDIHGDQLFRSRVKGELDECMKGYVIHSRNWLMLGGRAPVFMDVNKAPLYDELGNILGVVVSAHDITDAKLNEDRILQFANLDPLTDLPNRRHLFTRLNEELAKYRRHGHAIVVLFVDLDGFKGVNDSMGHVVGDKVLEVVAKRLHRIVRREDILARIGGDEFVLVAMAEENKDLLLDECKQLAKKILGEVSKPILVVEQRLHISASVGIHIVDDADVSADDVIKKADVAMYKAKQNGRNQFAVN